MKAGLEEGREAGRLQGFQQGLAEGREKGEKEGLQLTQAARAAMAERIERLDRIFQVLPDQLQAQIAARIEGAEEDMVALCYTVVCRLLGDRSLRRERVVSSVRQALEQGCKSGSHASLSGLLAIHVHPRDLEILQSDESLALWLAQHRKGPVPWVADEQVLHGGCIVRTDQGSLDARLDTQLQGLRDQILSAFPSQGSPLAAAMGDQGR